MKEASLTRDKKHQEGWVGVWQKENNTVTDNPRYHMALAVNPLAIAMCVVTGTYYISATYCPVWRQSPASQRRIQRATRGRGLAWVFPMNWCAPRSAGRNDKLCPGTTLLMGHFSSSLSHQHTTRSALWQAEVVRSLTAREPNTQPQSISIQCTAVGLWDHAAAHSNRHETRSPVPKSALELANNTQGTTQVREINRWEKPN